MARKRKKRTGLYIFLFLGIILSLATYYKMTEKKVVVEKVAVEAAQKRTIVETVYSSGKLFPATELEITSNISGTIMQQKLILKH